MATALLVVRAGGLSETVTASDHAAATGGGGLDLEARDRYTVRDLLYALLLTSSNDASVALAEHVDGSEEAFVAHMNRLAGGMGLDDTHFVSPHGLDAPGHYSSATDLARLGLAVLRNPLLARVVATPEAVVAGPRGPETIENRNALLESYRGALGIKTGFTAAAGNVLVAAARRHHRTLIAVAMDSVDATRDARVMLDHGFARLARAVVVAGGIDVGTIVFPDAGAISVVTGAALRGFERPSSVELTFRADRVSLPIEEGRVVGTVIVRVGERVIGTLPARSPDQLSVEEPSWAARALAGLLGLPHRISSAL